MKDRNEYQNTNNNSNSTLLTPELYTTLLEEKSSEILRLKVQQRSEMETVSKRIKELNRLRSNLKVIKRNIRVSRRALRKERRKLKKINQSLQIENGLIVNLNTDFISQEKRYINLNTFKSKSITK